MALKDRLVEIIYSLKDDFSAKVSGVTGSFKKVDAAAEKSSKGVTGLSSAFGKAGKSAKAASLAIKATVIGALISLAATIASAVSSIGTLREEMDETAKAARSIGESAENMSALNYAAGLSGLAVQKLRLGMQFMTRVTSEAAKGTGGAVKAFDELGLSADELNQATPYEKLKLIAEALQEIGSQSDRLRLSVALFGSENARGFLTLMEQGAAGIETMTERARELGLTFSDEEAGKVEKFNDNLDTASQRFGALTRGIRLDLLERANSIMEFTGASVAKTRLESVTERIGEIRARLRDLDADAGSRRWFGDSVTRETIDLQHELKQAIQARNDLLSDAEAERIQARQRAAEREHNRKLAAIRNEGTAALEKTLVERRKAYQKNLADLARLRNEEKQIADEFRQLVDDVQQGDEAGVPDLIDTSKAKLDAQTALNAGDFDTAIAKAREAADMVREMKQAGAESNIVLTGLAKQIETIANESAAGRTKAKEGLLAEQKKQIDEVAQALENLPKAKISIDEGALRAELARLQQVLEERPLVVKLQPESVAGFGNQTDLENQISQAARQRGAS